MWSASAVLTAVAGRDGNSLVFRLLVVYILFCMAKIVLIADLSMCQIMKFVRRWLPTLRKELSLQPKNQKKV
jgi:hypothetical protein